MDIDNMMYRPIPNKPVLVVHKPAAMEDNKKIDYLPEMLEKVRARKPVLANANQEWVEQQLRKPDLT